MHDHEDLGLGYMHDHACLLDHQLISSAFFLGGTKRAEKINSSKKKRALFFGTIEAIGFSRTVKEF